MRFAHRVSQDLDFFCSGDFDAEALLGRIRAAGTPLTVDHQDNGTLRVAAGPERIKAEFFRYRYPMVQPLDELEGVATAGPLDVGLMKLIAITSRGSGKDFIDLYWIDRRAAGLSQILSLVPAKFRSRMPDPYHVVRSLGYFAEAEGEPPADVLSGPGWPEIRRWFAGLADRLLREIETGHPLWP